MVERIVQVNVLILYTEVSKMKSYDIEIRHFNRKKESIDIHSEESRTKIEQAVTEVISRLAKK